MNFNPAVTTATTTQPHRQLRPIRLRVEKLPMARQNCRHKNTNNSNNIAIGRVDNPQHRQQQLASQQHEQHENSKSYGKRATCPAIEPRSTPHQAPPPPKTATTTAVTTHSSDNIITFIVVAGVAGVRQTFPGTAATGTSTI